MKNLHHLLLEQLKAADIDPTALSPPEKELLGAVNNAYMSSDDCHNSLKNELTRTQSELAILLTVSPDMHFLLDKQNRLLDFKVSPQQKNDPPIKKMFGQQLDSIPIEDVRVFFTNAVKKARQNGKLVTSQFKIDSQSGIDYFEARFFPLPNEQIVCALRNITDAKTAELELIKSEQQYRTILESSPDPIIVYDMEGNTEYLNPAFTKVFGWSLLDLKNGPVSFVPEEAWPETQGKIQQLKAGVDVQGFETQRYNRDGDILDVIINAALRKENEGAAIGTVVTIVNISRQKNLEKELRLTKDEAEAANQAKSEFLANMSHELRTPMHAILGFAKIASDRIDHLEKRKLKEFVNEVYLAGQSLMSLLNNLLDISKLEVGRVEYDMKVNKLTEIVLLVIHEFEPVATEKELTIEFDKPEFDDQARFDQNKMIQVIRNLVSNAIKFSNPKSKIIINITRRSGILMLSFKDFGIGIPADELETVFDKFVQSSKSKSESGGTGLGLAISKEIIDAHKGRIWAKNNSEGGTTFFMSLSSI